VRARKSRIAAMQAPGVSAADDPARGSRGADVVDMKGLYS
jgi:hypothetical protein